MLIKWVGEWEAPNVSYLYLKMLVTWMTVSLRFMLCFIGLLKAEGLFLTLFQKFIICYSVTAGSVCQVYPDTKVLKLFKH